MERGLSQESYDLKGNPRFFFLRLPENCAYISGKSTGRLGSIVLLDAPSSTIRFSLIVLLDSADPATILPYCVFDVMQPICCLERKKPLWIKKKTESCLEATLRFRSIDITCLGKIITS